MTQNKYNNLNEEDEITYNKLAKSIYEITKHTPVYDDDDFDYWKETVFPEFAYNFYEKWIDNLNGDISYEISQTLSKDGNTHELIFSEDEIRICNKETVESWEKKKNDFKLELFKVIAQDEGYIEISSGVYLMTGEEVLEETKGFDPPEDKESDYLTDDYNRSDIIPDELYLQTNDGYFDIANDKDILKVIESNPDYFLKHSTNKPNNKLIQSNLSLSKLSISTLPLSERFLKNRFQPQQGHPDGLKVGNKYWVIWDTVLNQAGSSGVFFENKKEFALKKAEELNSNLKETYDYYQNIIYKGYGIYTSQLFEQYGTSTREIGIAGIVLLDNSQDIFRSCNYPYTPEEINKFHVGGVLEGECTPLKNRIEFWAKENNIDIPNGKILCIEPLGARKHGNDYYEFSKLAIIANNKSLNAVVQLSGTEAEYAMAIDFAHNHNFPCFLINNDITKILSNNLDFVTLCKNQEEIFSRVKNYSLDSFEKKENSFFPSSFIQKLKQFVQNDFSEKNILISSKKILESYDNNSKVYFESYINSQGFKNEKELTVFLKNKIKQSINKTLDVQSEQSISY